MNRRVGFLLLAVVVVAVGARLALGNRGDGAGIAKSLGAVTSRILYADSVMTIPSGVQAVTIVVTPTITFNPATGYYTYSYSVHNSNTSTAAVTNFALASVPRPLSMSAPAHWAADRWAYAGGDSAIVWGVVDLGTLPPGYVDTGNLAPSQFNIAPGATLSGFSFVTPIPPITNAVSFFAQGFDTLQNSEEAPGDVETGDPTIFEAGVTGSIDGPGSGVGVEPGVDIDQSLGFAHPNPTSGTAEIAFYLGSEQTAFLRIRDVAGRDVRVLARQRMTAGSHSVVWDGRNAKGESVAPGVYFYELMVDGKKAGSRKIVVTK